MTSFNNALISAIQEQIPKKREQQCFLKDIIPLGKETIYRRLRGEIPFTFSEACIIARKLGISLDSLANVEMQTNPKFELEISVATPSDYIAAKLEQFAESYSSVLIEPNLVVQSIFSCIPYPMFFPFKNLFNFKMFKFLYQLDNKNIPEYFSEFSLHPDLEKKRLHMVELNRGTPKDTIIVDRKMFVSLMEEIKFFHSINVVSDEDKKILRTEMLELLDYFEHQASFGIRRDSGTQSLVYLSNIHIDHCYTYVKADNYECAYMDGIYALDTISTTDPRICKIHLDWIESLKRFSTLISVSGEIERRAFFSEQKRLTEEILNV